MSFFEFHKPETVDLARKTISRLRETLDRLECEREETPQIADLKRILARRIAEMERKTA